MKPIPHGTANGYRNYRCRCDLCRQAVKEYDRKRRELNPDVQKQQNERTRRYRDRYPDRVKESNKKRHERDKALFWDKLQAAQKVRNEAHRLRSKGLAATTEAELLAAQNGLCAICGKSDKRKLSIDHCHETGRIRGLLCRRCNLGLGCFGDNRETLKLAIEYLEKN